MKTKAFTLIELIMVIVVMGVIAVIGADIITATYDSYFRARTVSNLEQKTETTLEFIAKRLQDRVRGSTGFVRGTDIFPINQVTEDDQNLIWIGASAESSANWSGAIDMNASVAARSIITPGSDLSQVGDMVEQLTEGNVDIDSNAGNSVAIILKTPPALSSTINEYWNNTNNNYTTKIRRGTPIDGKDINMELKDGDGFVDRTLNGAQDLYEQYYLSHTAYAIVPVFTRPAGDPDRERDFNLTLRYNFRPWDDNTIFDAIAETPVNATTKVLASHVSTFRYRADGSAIRIKLCIADLGRSTESRFSACKETVVF